MIGLALGGAVETGRWLFVALDGGRAGWGRVLAADEPMVLQELFAVSPAGDLSHPSEVPLEANTTPAELCAILDRELGPDARVIDIRLRAAGPPPVTFSAHDERSVRFEADSDAPFARRLARLSGDPERAWGQLLSALRYEALTERYLQVELGPGIAAVRVYAGFGAFELDDPSETIQLDLASFAADSTGA